MKKRLGEVYWANSKLIDKTDKKDKRQYVVVRDNGKNVKISKIRGYNNNLKNEERLFELDLKKYPLTKRSGVDRKTYSYRSDNKKLLRLEDVEVFNSKPTFKLSSHDTHKVMVHTGILPNKKKKRKY